MMQQRNNLLIAFALACLLHAVVLGGFYFSQINHSVVLSALWSGGQTGYDVTVVSMVSIDPVSSKGPAVKQALQNGATQAKIKKPTAGLGNSDTPVGGVGSGLDKTGDAEASSILAQIRKQIMQHKEYPLVAKENRVTGTVKLKFAINQDGSLNEVVVTQSSGQNILDDAAKKAIGKAAPFPYYPDSIMLALEYKLNLDSVP